MLKLPPMALLLTLHNLLVPNDAALGVPGAWFLEVLPPAGVVCTHPTESMCEAPQSTDPPVMT